MGSILLTSAQSLRDMVEVFQPDVLVDGHQTEARSSYFNLSWARYLGLDEAFGNDRPGPRFYYLDGALEIMSTSEEHERLKEWIGAFMEIYFEQREIDFVTRGQATLRLAAKGAGAEPDKSWCLGEEKEFPDLVLEIALSSGGLDKRELYQRFAVPEVWIWRRGGLEAHALLLDGSGYERVNRSSRLLPDLDVVLLERCVRLPNAREARRAFRAGLASGR